MGELLVVYFPLFIFLFVLLHYCIHQPYLLWSSGFVEVEGASSAVAMPEARP